MKMENIESKGKSTPDNPPSPLPGDAVFTSAHAALKFAANFSHGTLKKSFLATAQGGIEGSWLGWTRWRRPGRDDPCRARAAVVTPRRNLIAGTRCPAERPLLMQVSCCRGFRERATSGGRLSIG
jgi:hypothetical protein